MYDGHSDLNKTPDHEKHDRAKKSIYSNKIAMPNKMHENSSYPMTFSPHRDIELVSKSKK